MSYETRDTITEPILKTYLYGSKVYGCNTEKSDSDFIIVVESDNKELYYSVVMKDKNFTVYSESLFIEKIKEHHINVLECIFQDEDDPFVKYFKLDKAKLRRAISSVSSNSFVKCKKKLKQGDYYIGKKSLFHSLRILEFGIQIAIFGKIMNYSAYNYCIEEIMAMETNDWEDYKKVYQPIFNDKKSLFRILAPLEDE